MTSLLNRHLDRAKTINRDLVAQAMPGGGAAALGPLTLPGASGGGNPQFMSQSGGYPSRQPVELGAGYRNQYGTNVYLGGDPTEGSFGGRATIPIGAAENALYLNGRAGYTPQQGFSGFLGVTKRNVPSDPAAARAVLGIDRPGGEEYSYGVSLNDPQYSAPPLPSVPSFGAPYSAPSPQAPPTYTQAPPSSDDWQKQLYGSSNYAPARY